MNSLIAALFTVACFVAYLFMEKVLHERRLRGISIRILVNGTRGKTSVTRMLAAALNAAGIVTYAKSTGSAARWILPDGSEEDYRKGKHPSMKEQVAFVRRAAQGRAQAIVVECMALRAENQRLIGHHQIRPTITIITNAHVDHVDEIGETKEETIRSLALSIHPQSTVISGETGFAGYTSKLIVPDAECSVPFAEQFSFPVYKDNLALVMTAVNCLQVPVERAMLGMLGTKPDIGMRESFCWRRYRIRNAFSSNDPTSFADVLSKYHEVGKYLLLYNHREDRTQRLRLMVEVVACSEIKPERIGVIGTNKRQAVRYFFRRTGIKAQALRDPFEWLEALEPMGIHEVLCAGNIKGDGDQFITKLMQDGFTDA